MKKYTILHTIETGGPGGAETVLLNLASRIDPDRFRSVALVPGRDWLHRELQRAGIQTFVEEGVDARRAVMGIAKLVKQERVDLIHSHLPDQNFYSCLAGRLTSRKTIATYHGMLPTNESAGHTRRAAKLWVVRHSAAAVVAVSECLMRSLLQLGFPARKTSFIYNGVDPQRFTGIAGGRLRQELGCTNGARLVGMVANLRSGKNYDCFVRAARQVANALPDTKFLAVGDIDGEIGREIRHLLRELSFEDRFFLMGFRSDIREILADLDVFVLSSSSEGFSLATVEAMAAGTPVVVTRSGGPEEIVDHARTGLLVPPNDPNALADGICALLANPEQAALLGRDARSAVEKKFSLNTMVARYEKLYEHCLGTA